jgi:hypothetical protein
MTVKQLLELLSKLPPQVEVFAFDPDDEEYEPVSGIVWDPDGHDLYIETAPSR